MKATVTTITSLFFSLLVIGQARDNDFIKRDIGYTPTKADSLKTVLAESKTAGRRTEILRRLGWLYVYSFPDSAIRFGQMGLRLAEMIDSENLKIDILTILGQALAYKGNFPSALKEAFRAIGLSEKSKDKSLLPWCLVCAGAIYFYAEDYNNALRYYLRAKNFHSDYEDNEILRAAFIGESYFHLNQYDSATAYIRRAYNLQIQAKTHWSVPYLYMGKLHEKRGLLAEALVFYHSSIEKVVPTTDSIKTCLAIANLFRQLEAIDSSIFYAKLAFSVAQKTSAYLYVSDASSILKELYKIRRQTDSAFKYAESMSAAKDSVFNNEKLRQMQNLTFNEQQRQQEILVEKDKFRSQLRLYGLAAGLVAFVIIAMILFRSNRFKQRAYVLLQNQKKQTDVQRAKAENALAELKSAQAHLIQSEKMASLGELTAGIAHEIQNPLNFVNNFSEVSNELIGELVEEVDKGNTKDVKVIANDIKQNLEKINHHGKRADAIVKGMLQHSRTSTGHKEPTDINALCDEYLRLAYHGLRAKDKKFNLETKTDFDNSIGKISIVPQDIGRVILNLINNAFYAVNEKAKQRGNDYQPNVTITSRSIRPPSVDRQRLADGAAGDRGVQIIVIDNGGGIPKNIVDKIFQPFFTTKPTGQGTGLGLSLAYDIIKAHDGDIRLENHEGEGCAFIIRLPA